MCPSPDELGQCLAPLLLAHAGLEVVDHGLQVVVTEGKGDK